MATESMVQLGDDGELHQSEDMSTFTPSREKVKNSLTNADPIILWHRPFPDQAGYDLAELYVDPGLENDWIYVLFLQWKTEEDKSAIQKTRRLTDYGFEDQPSAIHAGVKAYRDQVRQVIEANKNPEKRPPWKVFVILIVMWLMTGAFASIIAGLAALFALPVSKEVYFVGIILVLLCGFAFTAVLASTTRDNR